MKHTNKYNYIDVVNQFVPEFYRETDFAAFGSEEDVSLTFCGKVLKAAIENNLYWDVSGYTRDELASFFISTNKLTRISPKSFDQQLLAPYGKSLASFRSAAELKDFVSGTLLPDTRLNDPSGFYSHLSSIGFGAYSSVGVTHEYLVDTLGMFYFFNTPYQLSSTEASSCASSLMLDALVDPILAGREATEQDAINVLFKHFWYTKEETPYNKSFIPLHYASGTAELSGATYASGTQLLSSVLVQLSTWTSPRLRDQSFLTDSLGILLDDGPFPVRMRDAGPFQRFLKAISLGIADINLILEDISYLLSIEECPTEFLELLGNNIGWRFLTGDYTRWRAQLRNAVLMYKTKGSVTGLDAALRLIFPDGTFSSEDVAECWECYIPKLLYYLLKTESWMPKVWNEGYTLDEIGFNKPADITWNIAPPTYVDALDRNIRFGVDMILEEMHRRFKNIQINGKNFRKLPMWTCIPEPRGFSHRNYPQDTANYGQARDASSGFLVRVPPWEKYGFYRQTEFNQPVIDFLCNTLSGTRGDFGFEVNQTYVQAFRELLTTAREETFEISGLPKYSDNNKFRFFVSGHTLPPNYTKLVQYGHASSLSDFDTWNTKSSYVFSQLYASSMDFAVERYDTFRNKAALEVFRDVLRDFVPLHVTARITVVQDLEDWHSIFSQLSVQLTECMDDFSTEFFASQRAQFWAGASGTGDLSATVVNQDGRILPAYDISENYFWHGIATDLDRNTSRRRNYRYALDCYPYTREGKSQPVALNHYQYATAYSASKLPADQWLNTTEYIVKGFDYLTQAYEPSSSSTWDFSGYYNNTGAGCLQGGSTTSGYDLSSSYPIRAVPETDMTPSSHVIYRNNMRGIVQVITSDKIRKADDPSSIVFSDLDYRSYNFGTKMHKGWNVYTGEFGTRLKNTVSTAVPFYGGYNFISYAYGPTIYNSDFRYRGEIVFTTQSPAPITSGTLPGANQYLYGYDPQWSGVVGGSQAGAQTYVAADGAIQTVHRPSYFKDAPIASSVESERGRIPFVMPNGLQGFYTREILSGLYIAQTKPDSESFIIINDGDASSIYNSVRYPSVSFYNVDGNSLRVQVPLGQPTFSHPADGGYNKLRGQSQFRLDLTAKTVSRTKDQSISVHLMTSGAVSNDGNPITWAYSWQEGKWLIWDATTTPESKFVKNIPVGADISCPEPLSLNFHTMDILTEKEIPCGRDIKSATVHTGDTGYLLSVWAPTPITTNTSNAYDDGVTLYEISFVDTVLNHCVNDFNSYETYEIYKFWDSMAAKRGPIPDNESLVPSIQYYSRDELWSSGTMEASGGSKGSYIELLGDDNYSASGTEVIAGALTCSVRAFTVED